MYQSSNLYLPLPVNIGERVDVVPIVDGYIVEKGVYRLPYGGRQITEHLTRLLTETGHRLVLGLVWENVLS